MPFVVSEDDAHIVELVSVSRAMFVDGMQSDSLVAEVGALRSEVVLLLLVQW